MGNDIPYRNRQEIITLPERTRWIKGDRKPHQQVCVDEAKVLSGTRLLYKWKIVVKHGVVVSIVTASLL